MEAGDRQDVGDTCEMLPTKDSRPGLGVQVVVGVSHTGSEHPCEDLGCWIAAPPPGHWYSGAQGLGLRATVF